jgi:hypothetical protein
MKLTPQQEQILGNALVKASLKMIPKLLEKRSSAKERKKEEGVLESFFS